MTLPFIFSFIFTLLIGNVLTIRSNQSTCLSFNFNNENNFLSKKNIFIHKNKLQDKNNLSKYENIFSLIDLLNYSYLIPSIEEFQNSECKSDIEKWKMGLKNLDLWAVKMLDSTGKIPSGILNGNTMQFGDFDECLSLHRPLEFSVTGYHSIQDTPKRPRSQYCLAEIQLTINPEIIKNRNVKRYIGLDEILHLYYNLHSHLDDPGHRIARANSYFWGICLPESCSNLELESVIKSKFNYLSKSFNSHIRVESQMCRKESFMRNGLNNKAYWIIFFLIGLIIFVIFSTIYSNSLMNPTSTFFHKIVDSFSLKTNIRAIFNSLSPKNDRLSTIHGARALNALALLLFHKAVIFLFNPLINKNSMIEQSSKSWGILYRSATLYTDSFFFLSGLLSIISILEDLNKKGRIEIWPHLLQRYFRITPSLAVVLLISAYLLPQSNNGPLWPLTVGYYGNLCQSYIWRNLLYIQNFFPFEKMCLTNTYQVALDIQLYFILLIIMYILYRHPRILISTFIGIVIFSSLLRYYVTKNEQLSTVIYFGIPSKRLYRTANLTYILPSHRLSVYIIGVLIGYFLKKHEYNYQLNYLYQILGWIMSLIFGLGSLIGPYHMALQGYKYDPEAAALFNALAPLGWTIFQGWVVFITALGYADKVKSFLSLKVYRIFTKFALAVYLLQFPIYFYNAGTQKTSQFYTISLLIDFKEISAIIFFSILLTLFIDLPFQNLYKYFIKSR